MGVDDVEGDFGVGGRGGGAGEHVGFEQRDAVEAPGGVGEFLDELRFGGSGGLVFVEELAAVVLHRRLGLRRRGRGKRLVRPWRKALRDERCLPAAVRGPVECWELARLMAARVSFGLAHNGLASGAAKSAEGPVSFRAALGGLCAFG